MRCAKCDNDIPEHEGVGRPRKFCDDSCLKAATKEMRRLDTRIASLEMLESQSRISNHIGHAARIRVEIDDLEMRMRKLLNAGADETASKTPQLERKSHETASR